MAKNHSRTASNGGKGKSDPAPSSGKGLIVFPADRVRLRRSRKWSNRFGPFSEVGSLALLDGNSRMAKYVKRLRGQLIEHVGGSPNAVQAALIDRACMLALKLHLLDAQMLAGADYDSRKYLAWDGAYRRTLQALGLKAAEAPTPSLTEWLEQGEEEEQSTPVEEPT